MSNKQIETTTHENKWRTPLCDIFEDADKFEVLLDMPGVDKKCLDVTFQNGILSITGHVEKKECSTAEASRREYISTDFRREFSLSDQNIAVDKIKAELKDGELKLTLPKSEKVKPRKIDVKSIN